LIENNKKMIKNSSVVFGHIIVLEVERERQRERQRERSMAKPQRTIQLSDEESLRIVETIPTYKVSRKKWTPNGTLRYQTTTINLPVGGRVDKTHTH